MIERGNLRTEHIDNSFEEFAAKGAETELVGNWGNRLFFED